MRRISFILYCLITSVNLPAQDAGLPPRPYKPEELKRWSTICEALQQTLPATFKDYNVKLDDCGSFSWAETNNRKQPLTLTNKKNEPIGNNPNFSIWYSRNPDSVDIEEQRIQLGIPEARNPDGSFDNAKLNAISTKTEKLRQTSTLRVYMVVNSKQEYAKQYYKGTQPIKLELPIPGFAYLYVFPAGQEVKEEGSSIGTDGLAFYKDKALIVLSATTPKVTSASCNCSWKEEIITPRDNAPDNIMSPVKNIVIDITGGEEDVRAIIRQINWKALQSLLGK